MIGRRGDRPAIADRGGLLAEACFTEIDATFLFDLRGWLDQPLRGLPPGLVRTVAVVLGELVANAFRHAAPPFTARLTLPSPGRAVRVEVHDSTPTATTGWPLGRGLLIVRDLSPGWGIERRAHSKTVWAEIPVPPVTGR